MSERGATTRHPLRMLVVTLAFWVLFQGACVGRPQVFTDPLAPASPAALPETADEWPLRVALFNVWAIPVISDDTDERLARMPEALRGTEADIICLQEVWTDGSREQLADGLAPDYAASRSDGGGLMILSRFPIISEKFIPFPAVTGLSIVEWIAAKGMLEAVVRTPAGPVRVVTAHLALAFGEGNPRTTQLEFLLDRLDALRDMPLILAADLNTPAVRRGVLALDYLSIIDRGFTDLKPPVERDGVWDPGPATRAGWPRPAPLPHYHPDAFLVRPGGTGAIEARNFRITWETPQTALSDHNLLLADLRLRR